MLDYIYEIFHINKNLDILIPFQYKKTEQYVERY